MSPSPFRPDVPGAPDAITPRELFFGRRAFLRAGAAVAIVPAACAQEPKSVGGLPAGDLEPPYAWPEGFSAAAPAAPRRAAGVAEALTPREVAASHNNFYEFLYGGGGRVAPFTKDFVVTPWQVEVTGLCAAPTTFSLDDLLAIPQEERVCHFRCVERWAMNVPWTGFPLARLLERVKPEPGAKFVRFVSASRPAQMPGLRTPGSSEMPWPYHEGLRLDEAMHDLCMLATGIYGEPLLKQHGAPVRLVVPWKYGYKSPKSIVRIELVAEQPPTFWSSGPYGHEYGFLSNVNPNIPHPRWSQAESFWLGDRRRFPTPIFNGYGEWVAGLYPDEPTTPQAPRRPGETAR